MPSGHRAVMLAVMLLMGCPRHGDVQCTADTDCNRGSGGLCRLAETNNRWCEYLDDSCPEGYRYSDLDVGDALSGSCVNTSTWVTQLGSIDSNFGEDIAVDADGNLIAVGSFYETVIPAPGQELTSAGDADIYVIKSTLNGGLIWAKRVGGSGSESARSVAVDARNNLYIVGFFASVIDFDNGHSLQASGPFGALYVLKLDSNGDFGWARKMDIGASIGPSFRMHITANDDAVVVAGSYFGSITVDSTTHTSQTPEAPDIFVVRMSADAGATDWVKVAGQNSFDTAEGVALDNRGDAVVVGSFSGSISFDCRNSLSSVGADGFMVKLATDGSCLFLRQLDGVSPRAVAVDSTNDVLTIGDFRASASVGCAEPLVALPPDTQALILAKHSPAGGCIWARGFGGAGSSRVGTAITTNNAGDVATVGTFNGTISFDEVTLVSTSDSFDIFMARFSTDGTHLNSVRAGGTNITIGNGIAQSSDGRLFVTGYFAGYSEFLDVAITTIGNVDAFIVGLAP